MDAKLAEIYGNNKPSEADLEKMAAAELAEKLAGNGEVDINDLSEEQLEALAQEVLAGGEQPQAQTEQSPEEKVAEADYLGRVMAHAHVQELREIEKTSAEYGEGEKEEHRRIARGVSRIGAVSGGALGGLVGQAFGKSTAGRIVKGTLGAAGGALAGKGLGYGTARAGGRLSRAIGGKWGDLRKKPNTEQPAEKAASAMDTLVGARISQILEANGIDPAQLEQPAEKTSSPAEDVLAQAVDQRAWAALQEMGFTQADEK